MAKYFFWVLLFIISLALPARCFAIDPWPAGAGQVVASLPEASGAVWHEERQTLFVVQNTGFLVEMSSAGETINTWTVAGDLEAITLAEGNRYLYLGIEHPDSIIEFDLQTETLTGKSWNLTTWMTGADNSGLEGLAYSDGYFHAGLQSDALIYVFDVDLDNSGQVSFVQTIQPNAAYASDISGMDIHPYTGIDYLVYDSYNGLVELNADNVMVHNYVLPGINQEGIVLVTDCAAHTADVYIAEDNGQLVRYPDYPVSCIDGDSDGTHIDADCNDADASISSNQTYYRDADGDGQGSDTTTAVCSLTAPAGYVSNSDDQNDTDFDNDGSSTGTDCNDADAAVAQNQKYYRDIDEDGAGNAATLLEVCSFSAPAGYVSQSGDPVDIASSGKSMHINGTDWNFFSADPRIVKSISLDYFADNNHEVIAVGLLRKKAMIVSASVNGGNVRIAQRRTVPGSFRSVRLSAYLKKKKFTTAFNGGRKKSWSIKKSGGFRRAK